MIVADQIRARKVVLEAALKMAVVDGKGSLRREDIHLEQLRRKRKAEIETYWSGANPLDLRPFLRIEKAPAHG